MNKTPHTITDELLDQLLANYQKPEDLIGTDGILKQLTKKLVERALDAELTHHLGHNKHQPVSNWMGNTRNGFSKKKLISSVTDAVADEVKAWQSRPLDTVYPIVYLDCIHSKVREGAVRVKAVYLALGINLAGEKEILGLWIAQNEGAKFWLQVVTELRNRGVQDIFVACVDGLKGFPEAIEAVFPRTSVQLCIVHMVRHSLNYVSWKRRAEVAADLKRIYQSSTADEAELRLGEFEAKWDDDYLPIGQSWRRNWARITPFFDFPPEIRKVIYTTNAIESVNMSLRKITKNRGSFPSDEALLKLFYLALRNISKKWTMPIRDWKAALTRFTISYEDRLPQQ
ncbi:hypothetical protein IPC1282_26985 [Pseudomonas aeruginosa]|uniref:IS256 family transposase n=1 Tax=Pseudomonas aeruginosa TaxID=287 RepID=UPI000F51EE1E|nr:IS256 family transposase [Pseudomonas aeruginosa]RPN09097.1 hypothetical protein IPC1282_26985 [Pseudomonas aeruginosa]